MKLKQLFETVKSFPTSKEEVEAILEKYRINNYTINSDLTVDVDGDVDLRDENLLAIPVKFGVVSGNVKCMRNKLETLLGSPRKVGGDFNCDDNGQLSSLEGAPVEVGGDFICSRSQLSSLKSAPREVGGDFQCSGSRLKTLIGGPREIGGSFYCDSNQLTSLSGAPREIGRNLHCNSNPQLKSLDGIGQVHGKIISDL